MPSWLIGVLSGLGVSLVMFGVNKLTTKGWAELGTQLAELKNDIEELKKFVWTTDQRIALEGRLVKLEGIGDGLRKEVDFTKSSHQEFLRLLERALIPVAHSPHTPELDALLEKRERGEQLKAAEWQRLIDLLREHAEEYADAPGKQVSLLSLRAIYMTHLRMAQKKEEAEKAQGQFQMRVTDTGKTSQEIRGLRK